MFRAIDYIMAIVLCAGLWVGQTPKQSKGALPVAASLAPEFESRGLTQRKQGGRGTCSVFAVTGALEFALSTPKAQTTRLSVEFLNWAAHKATGRTADGGFFSEIWKGYETYGI